MHAPDAGSDDKETRAPIVLVQSVGSTNIEAANRISEGAALPFWLMAREQTTGRGRDGRAWSSPPGNLYVSLACRPTLAVSRWSEMAFVASISLFEAVATKLSSCGQGAKTESLSLKWPNDVMLDGCKLSGILLETVSPTQGGPGLIVGLGVNCRSHPQRPDYPTTSLLSVGAAIEPDDLLDALAYEMRIWSTIWQDQDFAPIRDAWLDRAGGVGRNIRVRTTSEVLSGVFKTIDASGRLVLHLDNGETRLISAGDVFFGDAAAGVDAGRPSGTS